MSDEFIVWFLDGQDNRTRIKAYNRLEDAESKANRILRVQQNDLAFGTGVYITNSDGGVVWSENVQ